MKLPHHRWTLMIALAYTAVVPLLLPDGILGLGEGQPTTVSVEGSSNRRQPSSSSPLPEPTLRTGPGPSTPTVIPSSTAATKPTAAIHERLVAPRHAAPNDAQLARLRHCESRGDYGVVSADAAFRGAYQFHQATWNQVAAAHAPRFAHQDPAAMPASVQDEMAAWLWTDAGPTHWPVCGPAAV